MPSWPSAGGGREQDDGQAGEGVPPPAGHYHSTGQLPKRIHWYTRSVWRRGITGPSSLLLSDCKTSTAPNRPHCALCNTNSIHNWFLILVCTDWAIFILYVLFINKKNTLPTLFIITLFIFVHTMNIQFYFYFCSSSSSYLFINLFIFYCHYCLLFYWTVLSLTNFPLLRD